MPGRVSSRTSQLSARTSKSQRTSNPENNAADIPDEGPSTSIRLQICTIFANVQRSNTGQRKLIVGLRKIQEACCYEPTSAKQSKVVDGDFDEEDFNAEVARCVLKILPIKKSELAGDRVMRFLGSFLKHATEADNAIFAEEDPHGIQGLPETPSSRLTTQIISLALPLLQSKDKIVRFRCTQIISHLINTLDSVEDELFQHIRIGLLKRLRDRESNVRVQAVCGLGRLASEGGGEGGQDPEDSDDDNSGGVLERLLDVLQNDPSAEVRKSLLLNLPFAPSTLPFLLERARDLDAGIRRALYARLLPALGDFRHLSLTHREKLLRWGLRDRDENVRKATGKLFSERWIEDCSHSRNEAGEPEDLKPGQRLTDPSSEGLYELLERIDVVNAGNDGGIALDAMQDLWQRRPDYRDFVVFDELFWKDLSPESAFVARSFNDFCRQDGASEALQEKLPEVTRLAFLIQSNINALVEHVQKNAVQDDAEEVSVQQEFVVEQLLHIALTVDYSDEVGRRTMFSLMREALAVAELPEETTRLVVEVLRNSCGTSAAAEREFCGVVLEAIAEVHDTIMGEEQAKEDSTDVDDSFHSAQSELSVDSTPKKQQDGVIDEEKLIKEIIINMKCLHIAQCMLQTVECSLEKNAHLVTMLNNLVVPAVRSQEAPIRERGLLCLGLCCLLDKNLADENLSLFFHCFSKGHEQLQTIAIQIIGDILTAHPSLLLTTLSTDSSSNQDTASPNHNTRPDAHPLHKPIHKLFSKSLKSPFPTVQSTACAALSKLMLSSPSTSTSTSVPQHSNTITTDTTNKHPSNSPTSILNTDDLLLLLTTAYFDPDTSSNPTLRQSLSYFLPVYCHSRHENMLTMSRIALPVLHWCLSIKEEMDVDGEEHELDSGGAEMVGLGVVVAHLVDWTDSRKLAPTEAKQKTQEGEGNVHLSLAEQILEKCLTRNGVQSREERKLLLIMLGKLSFSSHSEKAKTKAVLELVTEAIDEKIAADATTKNSLAKVQNALSKAVAEGEKSNNAGRSRSRAQSVLPSAAEDENDDGGRSSAPSSATTTPAASPRKRGNRNVSAKLEEVDGEDASAMDAPSAVATPAVSPAKRNKSGRVTATLPLRRKITPPEKDKAWAEADAEDQENVPPPQTTSSPTKKARARPKRSTAPGLDIPETQQPDADADEKKDVRPLIKAEPAEQQGLGRFEEEMPGKKTRGRPARGTSNGPAVTTVGNVGVAVAAGRKSVRAGRRRGAECGE